MKLIAITMFLVMNMMTMTMRTKMAILMTTAMTLVVRLVTAMALAAMLVTAVTLVIGGGGKGRRVWLP